MDFLRIKKLTAGFVSEAGYCPVLQGIDLSLTQGSRHALIGQTGAGKSILGLSIINLLPDNARLTGQILFMGKELLTLDRNNMTDIRGKEIMMIFQNPLLSLNPVLSIGTQLCEIPIVHKGLSPDKARTTAMEMLELCGLGSPEKIMKAYPHELSGGMLQRAALAMGIICQPRLLIADEPLKGLDVSLKKQLSLTLARVCETLGITLLLITHNLKVARHVCNVSSVIYRGRILETADTETLFACPAHDYTRQLVHAFQEFECAGGLTN